MKKQQQGRRYQIISIVDPLKNYNLLIKLKSFWRHSFPILKTMVCIINSTPQTQKKILLETPIITMQITANDLIYMAVLHNGFFQQQQYRLCPCLSLCFDYVQNQKYVSYLILIRFNMKKRLYQHHQLLQIENPLTST